MEPSEKSEGMEKSLTEIFGIDRRKDITENRCTSCGGDAGYFRDALSKKEFSISGLCQKCQDEVFE